MCSAKTHQRIGSDGEAQESADDVNAGGEGTIGREREATQPESSRESQNYNG
jgi:hypothetical protein